MWLFNKKKRKERKVFGFLCDPKLALGVKLIAADLKVPIYVVAEHLLQLGIVQMHPALEDDDAKEKLQEHLINHHLLTPALDEQNENEYDRAVAANAIKEQKERQTLQARRDYNRVAREQGSGL